MFTCFVLITFALLCAPRPTQPVAAGEWLRGAHGGQAAPSGPAAEPERGPRGGPRRPTFFASPWADSASRHATPSPCSDPRSAFSRRRCRPGSAGLGPVLWTSQVAAAPVTSGDPASTPRVPGSRLPQFRSLDSLGHPPCPTPGGAQWSRRRLEAGSLPETRLVPSSAARPGCPQPALPPGSEAPTRERRLRGVPRGPPVSRAVTMGALRGSPQLEVWVSPPCLADALRPHGRRQEAPSAGWNLTAATGPEQWVSRVSPPPGSPPHGPSGPGGAPRPASSRAFAPGPRRAHRRLWQKAISLSGAIVLAHPSARTTATTGLRPPTAGLPRDTARARRAPPGVAPAFTRRAASRLFPRTAPCTEGAAAAKRV